MKALTVIGQGYVGLPLAQAASRSGLSVFGFDTRTETVEALNCGRSHIDDITDDDVRTMLSSGYVATTDPSVISRSDVIVICVPTPLGDAGRPDLTAVTTSATTIAAHLRPGTLVVLESTTYPGTTEEVLLPLLESSGLKHGVDFHVAFSPERVDPGSRDFNIANTPKIIGGLTETATQRAMDFYGRFVHTLVPLSGAKEAETAKLLENTYRHVNIALVNEMARFCHDMGIDIWEVIRGASTKPFGFQRFTPGPGVGGHCIPIDPNYLSFEVRRQLGYPFRFVELAQEINNSMPTYIVSRIGDLLNDSGLPIRNAHVLLLGVTYKPDIADQRESPAVAVAQKLQERGAVVRFNDPHVPVWRLGSGDLECSDLDSAVRAADIVVLLQNHKEFNIPTLVNSAKLFFDTRGVAPAPGHRL